MYTFAILALLTLSAQATGTNYCPLLGPAFPAPTGIDHDSHFIQATKKITTQIEKAAKTGNLSDSISLQIFSGKDSHSAFSFSHTDASIRHGSVGVREVDEDTVFRIGSNSKLWTMLLYMTFNGTKYFDEPAAKYVPELRKNAHNRTEVEPIDAVSWEEITIGQLASHQAGIARDYAFADLSFSSDAELESFGLPALPKSEKLTCGSTYPCNRKGFFNGLLKTRPLAPTSSTPIYSNAGYQILGYALEAIAKRPFEQILKERLIHPLNLTRSSSSAPNASVGVVPGNLTESWFNVPIGDETPAGGLYSSAKDMATVGRAILSSALVHPAVTRKWMKPASHTASLEFSVGHPWEIFSFTEPRLIDLYTKSGDLGKYSSLIVLSPDHDAGFVILAAGEETTTTAASIAENVAEVLVPTLENIAREQAKKRFAGTFALSTGSKNSSITIVADDGPGLKVSKWISNSVDLFQVLMAQSGYTDSAKFSIRLQPTGLQSPERIAFSAVIQGLDTVPRGGPFRRSCRTWIMLDSFIYGNVGLPEIIFNLNAKGAAVSLTSPALRVTLPKA